VQAGTAAATPVPGRFCASDARATSVLEPLARYLGDPEVTDLFVNGSTGLFVDRGRGRESRARVAGS
jgi:pilus assembly protein CpaF